MDDTAALTKAHTSGQKLFYPKPAAFYRITRALPVSGPARGDGAEIRIVGNGHGSTAIFNITGNKKPIELSGFILDGGYRGGADGEWSHGIDMRGARDVSITGNTIRNTYGDSIYVGSLNASAASSNIRIAGNSLRNPRRCNIAVVCGQDILISDNIVSKLSSYVAAIDLEPNANGFDFVRDVRVLGNRFDTAGVFCMASVSNGVDNTGLVMRSNRGHAWRFFHVHHNARLNGALITQNEFTAVRPDGMMFLFSQAKNCVLSGNRDRTACRQGYRSARFDDSTVRLSRNVFC